MLLSSEPLRHRETNLLYPVELEMSGANYDPKYTAHSRCNRFGASRVTNSFDTSIMVQNMLTFLKIRSSSPAYSHIETGFAHTASDYGESKEQLEVEHCQCESRKKSWLKRHWVAIGVHSLLAIGNLTTYMATSKKPWDLNHTYSESRQYSSIKFRLPWLLPRSTSQQRH